MLSFRVNPLCLVQICTPIAEQFKDKDEAVKFLEDIGEKVKSNNEALALTKVLIGGMQPKKKKVLNLAGLYLVISL